MSNSQDTYFIPEPSRWPIVGTLALFMYLHWRRYVFEWIRARHLRIVPWSRLLSFICFMAGFQMLSVKVCQEVITSKLILAFAGE